MSTTQQNTSCPVTTQPGQAINRQTGTIYSREELLAAFNRVCNQQNWKLAIKAKVAKEEIAITAEAVIFFAGCRPTFTPARDGSYVCHAMGYYAAIGS